MKTLIVKEGCELCKRYANNPACIFRVVCVPKYTGLGDLMADWIHRLTGISPCRACTQRRVWLNRVFPFCTKTTPEIRGLLNRILSETPLDSQYPFLLDETGKVSPYAPYHNV